MSGFLPKEISPLFVDGPSAPIASGLALGKACKEVSYMAPDLDICCRIGARGLSYRALVNLNQLIEILGTFDGLVAVEFLRFPVESVPQCRGEDLVEQSALSAAGNTCDLSWSAVSIFSAFS